MIILKILMDENRRVVTSNWNVPLTVQQQKLYSILLKTWTLSWNASQNVIKVDFISISIAKYLVQNLLHE